jgi:DNA polymerase bacteriophage-type
MRWIWADSETFYSKDYTLRKSDPCQYILDPRFEHICLGIAEGRTATPYLVDGPDIGRWCKEISSREGGLDDVGFVTHNALFDSCIMSWHYDWVPGFYACTLSMARTLLSPKLRSKALGSVAEFYGWQKGGTIDKVKGMSRADIIANGLWPEYSGYCLNDVDLCRRVFLALFTQLPDEEFILHDMILRTAIEPTLRVNADKLAENLAEVQADKANIFARAMLCGINNIDDLKKDDRLAEVLEGLGVEVPTKISPTTGKQGFAFARSDTEFMDLLDHEDVAVRTIVQARLDHKSNIEETRSQRMLNIAQLEFPQLGSSGWMPIPLKIGAAHTHRLGGDWRLNAQNWGRQSKIREAIEAPEGYTLVVGDSEQIEARMNGTYCGQWDLVDQFRRGEDVYANFASQIFNLPVTKATHPGERFVGKTGVLQLGYQSGWLKFQTSVKIKSREETGRMISLTDADAFDVVSKYRSINSAISQKWAYNKEIISFMARAHPGAVLEDGPMRFMHRKMIGPNGLEMHYHNLRYDHDLGQWLFDYEERPHKLYGGKLQENIIQFLARIGIMQAAVRLKKPMAQLGAWLVMTSHDELAYLAPDASVVEAKALLKEEMSRSLPWMPALPISAVVGSGRNYADAK